MIFSDRMVLEMNVFPDRKFPLRWVLFSEGDEEGMSMTGYISWSHRDLHGHSVVILRKGFTSLTPYIISQEQVWGIARYLSPGLDGSIIPRASMLYCPYQPPL
ncbi:hypothetical protein DTO166G4_1950 [Paecilomyces variotii]|nr:hypothetical protein DTO164E3_3190 [Paecilomyces variotii]KAJ9216362.1 hypothetical protein DTO166G4_1950 [Paecilomyces variotii]KAJ9234636.1 hypothetical protein DTO166G5_4989 [Paecilomyces variotii]KAJ9296360.1 hypothetical protein DTO217A2_8857 [Paecilomyces variotii]